jgi:hypothetical protein
VTVEELKRCLSILLKANQSTAEPVSPSTNLGALATFGTTRILIRSKHGNEDEERKKNLLVLSRSTSILMLSY